MLQQLLAHCLENLDKRQQEQALSLDVAPPKHTSDGKFVSALVRDGRQRLTVAIDQGKDRAHYYCTCPARRICQHVFALALALVRAQLEAEMAASADGAAVAAPPPTWRRRIAGVKPAARPATLRPSQRPPLPHYAIDLRRSRAQGHLHCNALTPRRRGDTTVFVPMPGGTGLQSYGIDDRVALTALRAAASPTDARFGRFVAQLDGESAPRVLPTLFATGRVFVTDSILRETEQLQPVQLDAGAPWTFACALRRTADEVALHGALLRDAATVEHSQVRWIGTSHALLGDRMVAVDLGAAAPLAHTLLDAGPLAAAVEDEAEFLAAIADLAQKHGVPIPFRTAKAPPPLPILQLQMARPMAGRIPADLLFEYGERSVEWEAPLLLLPPEADGTYLERDRAREQQWLDLALADAGDAVESTPIGGYLLLQPKALRATVERLVHQGFRILADGRPMRSAQRVSIAVTSGIDWFDVHGAVEFDGGARVPLPRALAMLQRGQRLVELGDGTMAMLPEEWLRRWQSMAGLAESTENDELLRMHRSQALLLDALLEARTEVETETDAAFAAQRARLAAFSAIAPQPEPAGFVGTLRPYQQLGFGWLLFLRELGLGGCLADDMGLGKTIQVLALLQHVHGRRRPRLRRQPSLLVVPRSLLDNWRREAARFTPALRVLDFTGADRWQRLDDAGGFAAFDLAITTYGTMRLDAQRFDEGELRFEYAILDEAQAIENEQSLTHKAARLLRSDHRLALTGTPVQNHIGELWALFEFLAPGMLGKSRTFRALLGQGDDRGQGLDLALLHRALAPFLLRRTKAEVLTDLPPKQEQDLWCDLDGAQARCYQQLREHYRQRLLDGPEQLDSKERFVVLEALLRLRQAACHDGLIDPDRRGEAGAKLDVLLPMLQEIAASGHKALVFSQFTQLLAIVRERLDALGLPYQYLDGRTRKRQEAVDRFQQDGTCPVFLISLKAGGTGLNLTAADYVFLLDPWWNPAAEAQAIDRAHRIGQTRKVTAYRLIARGTVEEKVLALQQSKRALVDAVLGADASLLAELTRDDLAALLS